MPKSIGQIAKDAGVPAHRIQYLVLARGIRESGRVGRLRVYNDDAIEKILAALRGIDSRSHVS